MALKNVKTKASGSRHKGRWVTREEAKDGARRLRREETKKLVEAALVYAHAVREDEPGGPRVAGAVHTLLEMASGLLPPVVPRAPDTTTVSEAMSILEKYDSHQDPVMKLHRNGRIDADEVVLDELVWEVFDLLGHELASSCRLAFYGNGKNGKFGEQRGTLLDMVRDRQAHHERG